ncbi:MAG: hypothetical protein RIR00_727 [Pseudomonadota bacterium]|jgi:cobalt-zinc-cadmium efflux system membrane fusion protein
MNKRLLLLICCFFLAVTGCKRQAAPHAASQNDPDLVSPNETLLAQIRLGTVGKTQVSDTLRVAGRIDFDEQRLARIGAPLTGRIVQVQAQLGEHLAKGTPLAQLNSSELSALQLAFLKANAQSSLHRRNVERAKSLYQADVISAAELQRRENEYEIAGAETRAARDQLRILGMSEGAIDRLASSGHIDSVTPVVSTQAGVVVERKVSPGQVVQPGDPLFAVADLSRLWAVAQIPEQQISQVQVGDSVSIEVPALDNARLTAKLIYVGQTVNPDTRTVLVRSELDNSQGRLKPAMLASMLIAAKPVDRLAVPAAAVVRENDEDHVFVAMGQGQFRLLKVQLAGAHAGLRVVLAGLKGGEEIVVEGAFHLNNERNRKEMEGS